MLFAPYAPAELGDGLPDLRAGALLETAAGSGIVTGGSWSRTLPAAVEIVATDLNQAMVGSCCSPKPVTGARATLRQADALALPFEAARFDAVVCQFGAMFFPDRVAGYREARRVLKPDGRFVLAMWDFLDRNPMTALRRRRDGAAISGQIRRGSWRGRRTATPTATRSAASLARLASGQSRSTLVTLPSCAGSHRDPAIGLCQGTPMRAEIEAQVAGPDGTAGRNRRCRRSARPPEFGDGPIEAPMQALVIVARR